MASIETPDAYLMPALATRLDEAEGFFSKLTSKSLAWAREYSLFSYPFVTACCGMEYMSVAASRYDIARFGAEFPRFSPRQADLLMVVGTINNKQAPIVRRVFEQMAEPKWVMAFGVCASTGGFYDNYATVPGVDQVIPVDVYVPGCPPRPEQVLDGIRLLQRKMGVQKHDLFGESPSAQNPEPPKVNIFGRILGQ
jgi:NADH-quinone oxidoreductase subunit B